MPPTKLPSAATKCRFPHLAKLSEEELRLAKRARQQASFSSSSDPRWQACRHSVQDVGFVLAGSAKVVLKQHEASSGQHKSSCCPQRIQRPSSIANASRLRHHLILQAVRVQDQDVAGLQTSILAGIVRISPLSI